MAVEDSYNDIFIKSSSMLILFFFQKLKYSYTHILNIFRHFHVVYLWICEPAMCTMSRHSAKSLTHQPSCTIAAILGNLNIKRFYTLLCPFLSKKQFSLNFPVNRKNKTPKIIYFQSIINFWKNKIYRTAKWKLNYF